MGSGAPQQCRPGPGAPFPFPQKPGSQLPSEACVSSADRAAAHPLGIRQHGEDGRKQGQWVTAENIHAVRPEDTGDGCRAGLTPWGSQG